MLVLAFLGDDATALLLLSMVVVVVSLVVVVVVVVTDGIDRVEALKGVLRAEREKRLREGRALREEVRRARRRGESLSEAAR
mmetsp:Transcript_35492/g.65743  ORF Transcript_35492/g.65743 Transcript_35492/m.65743 type:complete len:82 (-) Transcript_35492:482-727(-)